MQKKKVQIPFYEQINDQRTVSELRYQDDLQRMRQEVTESGQEVNSERENSNNINKEMFLSRKKRTRKEVPDRFESSFLNITKLGLRKVLQEQKVKSITRNYMNKIKRNISEASPVEFYPYVQEFGDSIFNRNGLQIPNWFDLSFAFLSILQIFTLFFVYTLALVFDQFIDPQLISTLQTFSMCFYTIEIIINFVSIKTIDGRKITALKEIFLTYIKRKFFIDLLCLIILIIDIKTKFFITKYVRLCVALKMKQCLEKMEKIQNVFVNNFYKDQYWSLAKVFLINFGFAHVLAVLLLAMANLSDTSNWIIKIHVQNAPWYELYSWAYYWGTTIMLTVGFGDLSASNYKQALCLTVIETFSCILLAYNINCVGNLITNIRTQDHEKNKNFRIMRKLAESNQIKDQLQWKVCNFIDQSDKMKKEFGFEDEKQFISKLPPELKAEFLKESNIKIFQNITFLKSFTEKTLLNLAENIEVKIAHPEQIIFRSEEKPQLLILKQGKIGYCTRLPGSDFNGTVIDKMKIGSKETPKLVYLGFLTQNVRNVKFKIKSLHYSMIYFMNVHDVVEIMKNCLSDFENYCEIKDRSKHVVDQFQILQCQYCPTRHSKMNCPKLHYIPIYQMVVYKYLKSVRFSKNERASYKRQRTRAHLASSNPFKLQSYFKKLAESIYRNKARDSKKKETRKDDEFLGMMSKIDIEGSLYFQKIACLLSKRDDAEGTAAFEWDIDCDRAHNFKFYFSDCNSAELANRVILDRKKSKEKETDRQSSKCFPSLVKVIGSANFLM